MEAQTSKRVAEESTASVFQSRLIGSFKFVVFIFSLALVVVQYDRKAQDDGSGEKRSQKGNILVESRTPGGTGRRPSNPINHKEAVLGTALNSEEAVMTWFGRVFKGGVLIFILMLLRSWFPRKG